MSLESLDRVLKLRGDRTLSLTPAGDDEVVEIRSGSGRLELRVRLTEAGPVLEMHAVSLMLRAAESVDVECGEFRLSADAAVRIEAAGEVIMTGETIRLN